MTVSVAIREANDYGNAREVIADLTLDSSYLSGGEPVTAAMFGMRVGILNSITAEPKAGLDVRYIPTNKRTGVLKVIRSGLAAASTYATPGLQIGTTSNKEVRVNSTATYKADGEWKSKAAAEVGFTATTHDIAANASLVREAVYVVSVLPSDGSLALTMGTISSGAGTAQDPATPIGRVRLGSVRIAVAAGATPFDATTDALNAGHLTVTYRSGDAPAGQENESEVSSAADLDGITLRVTARGR